METRPLGEGGKVVFYHGLVAPDRVGRDGRGANRWRYLLEVVAIVALCLGLYRYMVFIHTPPECALENHHHTGNCPVQLIRWYHASQIANW
jgi:hypothetical protein